MQDHVGQFGKMETDRGLSPENPRDQEAYYSQLLADHANDILWVTDSLLRLSYISPSITRITGYSVEEAVNVPLSQCVTPASYELAMKQYEHIRDKIASGTFQFPKSLGFEAELIRRDGSTFWGQIAITLIGDDQGQFVKAVGITRDITERKRAEEALRESEGLYRALVENAQEGIWMIDAEYRTMLVNQPMADILGYSPEEMANRHVTSFMDETALAVFHRNVELRSQGIKDHSDFELIRKNGTRVYVMAGASPLFDQNGTYKGAIAFVLDVTKRREAEEALRASEERFRQIIQHSSDGINIARIDLVTGHRKLVLCNDRYVAMSGRTREELLNAPDLNQFVTYPVSKETRAKWREWIRQEKPYSGLASWIRPDGKDNFYEWTAAPVKLGETYYVIGVDRDITERRRAEEALRDSEERFRGAFENAATGMALVGTDGRFLQVNRTLCRMLGYSHEELLGMTYQRVTYSEDLNPGLDRVQGLLNTETGLTQLEHRYFHKQGHLIWVLANSTLVRDAKGDPLYFIVQLLDITDRKHSEEKIRAYQRQLRSLASRMSLVEERERRRIATDLHDHIGQMLAVSKIKLGQVGESLRETSMGRVVEDTRNLIEQALQYTRSLTFELSPPILYELGFEAAVDWLLSEVTRNHGVQTRLEESGERCALREDIRIVLFQATRELLANIVKHAQARHAQVSILRNQRRIEVTVEDDGVGFDPAETMLNAHRKHAFGLFHLRERLEHLGGSFDVKSQPGSGTRITLMAPLKEES